MRRESFGYDSANIECSWCGTVFFQKKYASVTKFCSNRCAKTHTVHNRNHRKRANGESETIGTVTLAKRRGYKCECCGIKCVNPTGNNLSNEITLDHIAPLSKGGSHTWDNVQLLCRKCNTFKRDMEWDNDRLIYEMEKHEVVKLAKAKPPGVVEIQPTATRSAYPSHAIEHKNEVYHAWN